MRLRVHDEGMHYWQDVEVECVHCEGFCTVIREGRTESAVDPQVIGTDVSLIVCEKVYNRLLCD